MEKPVEGHSCSHFRPNLAPSSLSPLGLDIIVGDLQQVRMLDELLLQHFRSNHCLSNP